MAWKNSLSSLGLSFRGSVFEKSILDIREWSTKRAEKTVYLMAKTTLVRVLIEATLNENFGEAGMSCKVIEINGELIPPKEQEEKKAAIKLFDVVPTPGEQMNLLLEALSNFQIYHKPAMVSDDYAKNYIRVLEMEKRLAVKRGKEEAR